MRFSSLAILTLVLPASVFALEISSGELPYTDGPFSAAESAGIRVLTDLGAVSGYGDGTFRPRTTINRAEALKIILRSLPGGDSSCNDRTWRLGIGFCLPSEWVQLSQNDDETFPPDIVLAFKRSMADGDQRVVLTVRQAALSSVVGSTAYSDAVTQATETLPFYQLRSLETATIDGENVYLHVFDVQDLQDAAIRRFAQLSAVVGRTGFTFEISVPVDLAHALDTEIRHILSSLTFVEDSDRPCFPDVHEDDWFFSIVCHAQSMGVVRGYPDGLFHPERSITAIEALTLLSKLYRYSLSSLPSEAWYAPVVQAVFDHRVGIPGLPIDRILTRGEMARLAAAFRAEHDGDLRLYRRLEKGLPIVAASSSSQETVSSAASSEESSVSSSISSVSSVDAVAFPARSHFLLLGETSKDILGDGLFVSDERALVTAASVRFERKIPSIQSLQVVDSTGQVVAELSPDALNNDPLNNNDNTWRWSGSAPAHSSLILPSGTPLRLGIRISLFAAGQGGATQETIRVKSFTITATEVASQISRQIAPTNVHFPPSQTARGFITSVTQSLVQAPLRFGQDIPVAAFTVAGLAQEGATIEVEMLQLHVAMVGIAVQQWSLASDDLSVRTDCSVNSSPANTISCPVPVSIRSVFAPRSYRILATMSEDLSHEPRFLQVSLPSAGAIGEVGALFWSDGTSHYTWVDLPSPLADGPLLR